MSNDLLTIDPIDLQFPFELKKQISCSLYLANKTDDYVAFKVKTTNPKKYCVRPNTGVVLPRSSSEVLVTMQGQKEAPVDMQCKDKLLLHCVVASSGVTAKEVTQEMFSKELGHRVEETKLRVVYVAPPQPPSPVREGSEEGSSPRASVGNASDFTAAPRFSADRLEPLDNSPEARALIARLTEEKNSAVQLNNKLQQELEQLKRDDKHVQTQTTKSKGNKKMKRNKLEASHEISIVSKDQDEENMVKDILKGEEEDDDEAERSAEPKPGETSSNMVLKKLLRGARYFDPPDAGWVTCYSCGEQGHITVNCPTPMKRRKPCFICGSLEHGAKQCSKGQDCYICKKSGHRAKDCPDKYKSGYKTAVCLRCGDFGHDMILCKYEYARDDLKDIQCYVCKSFGHLCCVETGNSPSWAVSCYRCGQLGHTGLACGRHFDESTEKDSVISSCFKCGGEGHLKRDCPNSSSLSFLGNSREIASACFRCGEEGHFSRECPNSSSIGTAQGRDSPSLCYKCNGVGHFARECPNSSHGSKRTRDPSTPSGKPRKKNKENSEHNSTPRESNGKPKKKKKTQKGEQPQTTPWKPKHRGGWITEDLEEDSFQRGKIRRPRSPITPSSHNHRLPTTPSSHNHRVHSTPSSHDHRSTTINPGGHFQGSQSTTPYGRNHRNSSFEPSGHHSGHRHHQQQPYYDHHHQQPYYDHHHQQPYYDHHHHHEDRRYAPAPSRFGRDHHYGEFARSYDRY